MLIDVDVHQWPADWKHIAPYLKEPYRAEVLEYGLRVLHSGIRYEHGGMRWHSMGPNGERGGQDPDWTAKQLMDRYGHRYALLSGNTYPIAGMPDPDYQAAIAGALNDWAIDTWLPVDERYRLAIQIPTTDPQLGAR